MRAKAVRRSGTSREGGPHRELRLAVPAVEGSVSVVLADVAQSAERVLGKDEVTGSIPVIGSIRLRARATDRGRYGAMPRRSSLRDRQATNEGGQVRGQFALTGAS